MSLTWLQISKIGFLVTRFNLTCLWRYVSRLDTNVPAKLQLLARVFYPHCLIDFPIGISLKSPFPTLGVTGVLFFIYILFLIEIPVSKQ